MVEVSVNAFGVAVYIRVLWRKGDGWKKESVGIPAGAVTAACCLSDVALNGCGTTAPAVGVGRGREAARE